MKTLRQTKHFAAFPAKRAGWVTIRARDRSVTPGQRTVRAKTWAQMMDYRDDTFDAAACWDLGLAAFIKAAQ